MTPGSGIRQGDSLSLAIFALLTVFLVYQIGTRLSGGGAAPTL